MSGLDAAAGSPGTRRYSITMLCLVVSFLFRCHAVHWDLRSCGPTACGSLPIFHIEPVLASDHAKLSGCKTREQGRWTLRRKRDDYAEKDVTGPGVCKELPVTRREVIRGWDELG
jgi:hypothetical protein